MYQTINDKRQLWLQNPLSRARERIFGQAFPNLLAINFVLWAYLRVLRVSSKFVSEGDRQATIRVRALPPRES